MEANQKKIQTNNGIKFLVATDIHLGHIQHNSQRGNDSFVAFQQVLQIAHRQKVDFLLLGGDLFDQVNPSQQTIYRCLNLLKSSVFGIKDIKIQAQMYKEKDNFYPNFANQNINIKLPIFTIHGNHDYPTTDFGKISICDLLHASNYVNYFGKHLELQKIKVKPLIISKSNQIKLAIYGLGYIKDSFLHNMFIKGKVQFQKVETEEKIISLLILHQNRYKKGQKTGAPYLSSIDSIHIPQWIDLTVWGHEHQAISKIEIENNRKIVQPGSTVITSFIQAQSYKKQVLLINTSKKQGCQVNFIKLQNSFRPMFCCSYQIQDLKRKLGDNLDLYSFLEDQVQAIIRQYSLKYPQKLPIIRLKIQISNHDLIRYKQLETKYSNMVANKQKIFHFWKRKKINVVNQKTETQFFQTIKNKKLIYNPNKQLSKQVIGIMYQKMKNQKKLSYLNQDKMIKFAQKCVLDQSSNTKAIISRYFQKILTESTQKLEIQANQFTHSMDLAYNKAIQQRISNIKQNINEDKQYQSRKNIQVILSEEYEKRQIFKKEQILNAEIFQIVKQEEEKQISEKFSRQVEFQNNKKAVDGEKKHQYTSDIEQSYKSETQIVSSIQEKKEKRPSILKKKQHQIRINSQNEQQSCCQKAAKTQYQQKKTEFNFKEAQRMIENKQIKKKKKKNIKKSVKFVEEDQNL